MTCWPQTRSVSVCSAITAVAVARRNRSTSSAAAHLSERIEPFPSPLFRATPAPSLVLSPAVGGPPSPLPSIPAAPSASIWPWFPSATCYETSEAARESIFIQRPSSWSAGFRLSPRRKLPDGLWRQVTDDLVCPEGVQKPLADIAPAAFNSSALAARAPRAPAPSCARSSGGGGCRAW